MRSVSATVETPSRCTAWRFVNAVNLQAESTCEMWNVKVELERGKWGEGKQRWRESGFGRKWIRGKELEVQPQDCDTWKLGSASTHARWSKKVWSQVRIMGCFWVHNLTFKHLSTIMGWMHALTCTCVQLPKWLLRVKEEKEGKEEGKQERGEKGVKVKDGWYFYLEEIKKMLLVVAYFSSD